MSDYVTLTLRDEPSEAIDVDGLTPDRVAALSEPEIAALPVWLGTRTARIGDFFTVHGERSPRLRIAGALSRVRGLVAGMATGEVTIEGSVGDGLAAGMTGGSVTVYGDAGNDMALGLGGGIVRINGTVGDRAGAAAPGASKGMTGGEIIITGSAGASLAARARRGLVVVGGTVGDDAAHGIIAGTVVVFGRVGRAPGRASKRGSIVAIGGIDVPPTYRYACTYEPPHLRLLFHYVRRRHQLAVADNVAAGLYRRYCGDTGDPGKGEILVWAPPEQQA